MSERRVEGGRRRSVRSRDRSKLLPQPPGAGHARLPEIDTSWLKAEPAWNDMMNPEMHFPLPPQSEEPWGRCVSIITEHDKELCAGWTEEINIMLVFAALFSAIVTAFIVESLKDIREDPAETSAQLLYQILAQMRNASTNPQPELSPAPQFLPPASAIWINSLWGVSLALSLLAVMLYILCLQWLRAFRRSHPGLSRDRLLAMRQMKYEGLMHWGTPLIVSSIPIILLTSLFLFFAGLVYYIYDSSVIVAIPLIVLTVVIAVIFAATTALPGIIDLSNLVSSVRNQPPAPYCFYRSPQANIFGNVLSKIAYAGFTLYRSVFQPRTHDIPIPGAEPVVNLGQQIRSHKKKASDAGELERWALEHIQSRNAVFALSWFAGAFGYSQDNAETLYRCVYETADPSTAWDISWAVTRPTTAWVRPLGDGGSHRFIGSLVKDIALLRLCRHFFTYRHRKPIPMHMHIHRMELYLRVWRGVMNARVSELQPYVLTLDYFEMFCPNISNNVNPRREAFPILPDSLRIQYLKYFEEVFTGDTKVKLGGGLGHQTEQLLSLLASIILYPLESMDPSNSDRSVNFLDLGFGLLLRGMQLNAGASLSTMENMNPSAAAGFCRFCLGPWTTRSNATAVFKNKLLLERSTIFEIYIKYVEKGVQKGTPMAGEIEVLWNRFSYIRAARGSEEYARYYHE